MTPHTFGLCIRCDKRQAGHPSRLCWWCRRMTDPVLAEVRREQDRQRIARKRAAEKAARPLHFTPPQ
jgi:hypothetical protein